MEAPSSQSEILSALSEVSNEVENQFNSIPADVFFVNQPPAWSPAEKLLHLIKSVAAVSKGLKLPRTAISLMFGKSDGPGKSFIELREVYLDQIKKGARASEKFVPSVDLNPADKTQEKARMIEKWKEVSGRLNSALEEWKEEDLDRYLMPHPILGKLTVREMLFFTLYHNRHHMPREVRS
jgi:hypothetical protein